MQALFEKQAVIRPEAVALCAGGHEYSYAEVNRRANRLGHRLQAMGIGPGDAVALSAGRCAESFVAMLGILKSGGLVVPLDPDYPEQRQRLMLEDAGASLVLLPPTNAGTLAGAAEQLVLASGVLDSPDYPDSNPTSPAGPETPAFLLYTSGSTGKPKGVCLLHQGLVNYIWQLGKKTGLTAADRVLQFASPSFDICVEETFAAWLHGAALVIREPDMNLSVQAFLGGCERHAISWASLPTAWWHELCNGMEQGGGQLLLPATLRSVVIGGEESPPGCLCYLAKVFPQRPAF